MTVISLPNIGLTRLTYLLVLGGGEIKMKEQLTLSNYTEYLDKESTLIKGKMVFDKMIFRCPRCNEIVLENDKGRNVPETTCKKCNLKSESFGNVLYIWE